MMTEIFQTNRPRLKLDPNTFIPVYEDGEVWIVRGFNVSVSRAIATDVMLALGLDPNDFRTRDKIINSIYKRVNGMLDYVKYNQNDA